MDPPPHSARVPTPRRLAGLAAGASPDAGPGEVEDEDETRPWLFYCADCPGIPEGHFYVRVCGLTLCVGCWRARGRPWPGDVERKKTRPRMVHEFATCRGCRARIEWALLNGNPHPFDVVPTDTGRGYELVELENEPGPIAVYVNAFQLQARKLNGESVRLVVSHFATCPEKARFEGGRRR